MSFNEKRDSGILESVATGPDGPVRLRWYRPIPSRARVPAPILVWAHGGGFFAGGIDQPEAHDVARALSDRGVTVVTVDYRLAPPLD
ncbi:alpha/beta hydrolase fold domain-containing protein [Paenarthrobacter sp. NPDC089714]|uniref:alpha/beta hydrolase fold domain-containing protein n=1 Tax=Paenarthrobacter sp. NPDC089714 TaxID=3364377 RepID=UPI00380F8747